MNDQPPHPVLRRELGTFGAVMMGLGSIIGTGAFVSIGIAAGIAGPAVILAVLLAAVVATCNALNSAQLAANHPVSGGTYEYGYRYLNPWLGFTAGWMFLCAKTASAATAAFGFSGYFLATFSNTADVPITQHVAAVLVVATLTALVLFGIRTSNYANIAIVAVTLIALVSFCVAGSSTALANAHDNLLPFFRGDSEGTAWGNLLQATALMFVAYTGYGRIATLGEEVREPRTTIPRAIVITLVISALLYIAVALVGIAAVGSERMSLATTERSAPLVVIAREFGNVRWLVAAGAMTAMLGVLLNLILGLSRMLLAMGRRGDMPAAVARLNSAHTTPYIAVATIGTIIAIFAAVGSVKTTWSFSAFTVLIYYAITNFAALRLTPEERLYSRVYALVGLAACLFLAFWVDVSVWLTGLGVIALGLLWHKIAERKSTR